MQEQLLTDIKSRLAAETRPPEQIYAALKASGVQMMMTNTLSREQVIGFCAGLIKLYEQLSPTQKIQLR